jgi:VWFA-related protein
MAQEATDGIRIDVPIDAAVLIENRFGDVDVEVWAGSYVTVSVVVAADVQLSRSPILLDNRGKVLSIKTVAVQKSNMINLRVRLPRTTRLEVTTASGKISVQGLAGSAVLKTVSGDIQSSVTSDARLKIKASSTAGFVSSTLPSNPLTGAHVFETRLGDGSASAYLESESGNILLSAQSIHDNVSPRKPELIGGNTASGRAGTPEDRSQSDELEEGDVIRVDSQLVTVNVSAIDRGTNRGLTGLTKSDFMLFEDGHEQVIAEFESSSEPFGLVLLIDLSGSTKEKVKLIREAALSFISAARPADRIAIVTFAGQPALVSGFTLDRELLRQRVTSIDTAPGDTKLYDAIQFVFDEVLGSTRPSRRTAVVLMSDGLDGTIPGVSGQIGSKTPYQDVLRNIQEFDGVLYTLWLNTRYVAMDPRDTQPEAFDEGHDRMKAMADAGGGVFYEVERLENLAGAYERVVEDLGTVYSLAYRPSNKARDGKWRAIRVDIKRSNAVARGKRGYYAN